MRNRRDITGRLLDTIVCSPQDCGIEGELVRKYIEPGEQVGRGSIPRIRVIISGIIFVYLVHLWLLPEEPTISRSDDESSEDQSHVNPSD